jgi:hypothetical protein
MGKRPGGQPIKPNTIISKEQSLRILLNDLRKAAVEKRSLELTDGTPEGRQTILAEIEREIRREMQKRATNQGHQNVIY